MHLGSLEHLRSEHNETILASSFGPVEGDVCVSDEFGGRVSRSRGDTDACGHGLRTRGCVLQLERRSKSLEQSLGDKLWPEIRGGSVDEHDELIAAETSDAVTLAHDNGEPLRY